MKTTLPKLLGRLYDVQEGRALIDGVDPRDYRLQDLQSQITALFQQPMRYQATVAQNIAMGNVHHEYSREAVEKAARQAMIHEVVRGLPEGYDTQLGHWFEGGTDLSGGQCQRIAMARVLSRGPARHSRRANERHGLMGRKPVAPKFCAPRRRGAHGLHHYPPLYDRHARRRHPRDARGENH